MADYVGRVAHAHTVDRQPNRLGHPGEIQLFVDSLHFDMKEYQAMGREVGSGGDCKPKRSYFWVARQADKGTHKKRGAYGLR